MENEQSKQTKLEQIAIAQRDLLLTRNTYNVVSENNYGPTHTRAKSDEQTPVNGKGTGKFLDVYNGGGSLDIHGSPTKVGSGRIKNIAVNKFSESKKYQKPDTSGNTGQIVIK